MGRLRRRGIGSFVELEDNDRQKNETNTTMAMMMMFTASWKVWMRSAISVTDVCMPICQSDGCPLPASAGTAATDMPAAAPISVLCNAFFSRLIIPPSSTCRLSRSVCRFRRAELSLA
jgi:hypothetical protein